MSEKCDTPCVLELCVGKTKQELQDLVASVVGATVLGYAIACDRDQCALTVDTLGDKRIAYGDCRRIEQMYETLPSSRSIAL